MTTRRVFSFALTAVMALMMYQGVFAAQETTVTLNFEKDQFIIDQLAGYDRIRMKDGSLLSRLGEPALPSLQIRVAIPSGNRATDVIIRPVDSQVMPGTYRVYPGQRPARLDGSSPPPFTEPDPDIYSSNDLYPAQPAALAGQTDLAGQQMAVVTVSPMQVVPATGELVLHRELEIIVSSEPGYSSEERYAKFTQKHRDHYEPLVRDMVINPQDVFLNPASASPSKALPSGDFDHVIITSSSYSSYFDDLVEWHNKRGLRDTVVTTTYIYGNYSGSDNQAKIRNFIIDARSTWGTMYFLMGGEDGTVPFEYRTYYGDSIPSDNYYADYDDDWTWEVYVGRISGSTSTQFSTAIDKIIDYEKNPPTSNYAKDVLLIGMDLTLASDPPYYTATPAEDLKETIDGYIPSGFNVTKVYDSHGTNHETATITALNAGQNLVNHADHSNSDVLGLGYLNHGSWALYNSDVDGLTNNGQPCNMVTMGCYGNDMTYSDGIGEHFVIYNPDQAGVSYTGNTRSGWFYIGYTEYLSCQLDRDWWRGLFNYDQHVVGHTLAWAKHQFDEDSDPDVGPYCEWTLNLLGDPAMPLWTDDPASLTVTHPGSLPTGSSSFLVHVESGGSDLVSAYVCLWKEGDVYLTGTTNSNGDVTFTPSPGTTGTMYVTVTKHNYVPYAGSATVITGGSDPSITVTYPNGGETLSGSATITWTATDPDPGETTLLDIDLEYSANGGGSWTPIATGETNDGSYLWDVSGLSDGSNYLVRATATDPTMRSDVDQSDATFSIYNPGAPEITVTYPNGGETLSGSATITWTATDPDPGETTLLDIDLEYSANAGGSWNPIASGESNDGSYLWDVSGLTDGSNYLVRTTATDPTMRTDNDESDAVFTIQNTGPPATVADLTATLSGTAIHLAWSAVTEDTSGTPITVDHYVIYRNADPDFIASALDSVASTGGTSYDDATPALKNTTENHFYVIKAVDAQGRKSSDSNKVGEFDRELITEALVK